jgi:ABC-type amino acid transport substrate-binding protein
MAMKRRMRNYFFPLLALIISFIATLLLSPLMVSAQETYRGEGKDQLVQALDAAIARVIDSGEWRAIVNSDSVVAPLAINIGDCYPRVEADGDIVYPFPANPVGLLKDIVDSKQIRVGNYDVDDPFVPGTFHVFDTVNPALLRAIIDELGLGYGLDPVTDPIQIVEVVVFPPSSALMFAGLKAGDYDVVGFNAALGATVSVDGVEKRRRDVARFTCTVFGTLWYIHVRDDRTDYMTFTDVLNDTTARLCVGQLSSRLSEDYFKNVRSKRCIPSGVGGACTLNADCPPGEICKGGLCRINNPLGDPCDVNADCATGEICQPRLNKIFSEDDLVECSDGVSDGTYDAYLHFDPDPQVYPDPDDLKVIPMQIVSGIPIWVDGEESCEGLDVCEGDLDANEAVDADDVAKFLEDFGRNQFNNPCPACVNGW